MRDKFSRRLASYALVFALTVLSVLEGGRVHKPFSTAAPDFREKGPADAKVQIAEFSDFQCPACRYAEPTVRQLFVVYGDKIRFIFKHFPLRMHQWARPAAAAAECAGRQGKFWEYHDRLYDHQEEWTNEKADAFLTGYARDAKLDMPAWEACRQSADAAAAVASDMKDGDNAWVGSTPTFFINGRRFVGGKQLAEVGTLYIDRELKK
ncbi:MAG: thioredoxin domain-containing protein [Elusimicrobia bacterium]|nr:thioredoxin domain-containing protein [Elusimicrobiota bacterium]